MILVWRGWGLVAIVALFLPLASCAGFIDTNTGLAILLGGITLAVGGVACWRFGKKWNREVTEHSLYGVPLQAWGRIYMAFGLLFTLMGIVGGIAKAMK